MVPFPFFWVLSKSVLLSSLSSPSKLKHRSKLKYVAPALYPWQTLIINHDTVFPFESKHSLGIFLPTTTPGALELMHEMIDTYLLRLFREQAKIQELKVMISTSWFLRSRHWGQFFSIQAFKLN